MTRRVYKDIATKAFESGRFGYLGKPKKVVIYECAAYLQELHSVFHSETPADKDRHLPYIAKNFFMILNNNL